MIQVSFVQNEKYFFPTAQTCIDSLVFYNEQVTDLKHKRKNQETFNAKLEYAIENSPYFGFV